MNPSWSAVSELADVPIDAILEVQLRTVRRAIGGDLLRLARWTHGGYLLWDADVVGCRVMK